MTPRLICDPGDTMPIHAIGVAAVAPQLRGELPTTACVSEPPALIAACQTHGRVHHSEDDQVKVRRILCNAPARVVDVGA